MGYTHYYTQTRDFTEAEFAQITDALKAIFAAAALKGITIADAHGGRGSLPDIDPDFVSFNGSCESSHESCVIERIRQEPYPGGELGWSCTKTARKPYDQVVTAVLTYLVNCWDYEVSSDGDVEDWEAGVTLAESALNREFYNPLIKERLMS